MTVTTILQGVRQFFGLPETASEEDALLRLNDELESRDAQEDNEEEEEEAVQEQTETDETESTEENATGPTNTELQRQIDEMRAEFTSQINELTEQVKEMAELSAGESTGGKKDPPPKEEQKFHRPIYDQL